MTDQSVAQTARITDIQNTDIQTLPLSGVSFDDYLKMADGRHAEWVKGEVLFISPASRLHQRLLLWLAKVLDYYVQAEKSGELVIAPFVMRFEYEEASRGREPDLFFVATENIDRLGDTALTGPADLIVEIVSPESLSRDRGEKFVEYESIGVPEYWIVDPVRKQTEFYQLGEDGHYHHVPPVDDVYTSAALDGFWLRPAWLWQDPLPNEIDILRQIGVL